jgi:hypothetical protein
MSETEVLETQQVNQVNFFDENQLETSPVQQFANEQETGSVPQQTATVEQTTTTTTENQPQVDYNQFVKDTFGYETLDEAKTEFEQLKKLKEEAPSQTFANDESKTLYQAWLEGKKDEVLDYLSNQKKIEKLATGEVNTNTAEEIVKLTIKQKNKSLTDDEVDFVFNQKFSVPSKPTQRADEYEEDYNARLAEWEEKAQIVQKQLIIEAKMSQPEIEKLKSELVLPNIQSANQISAEQEQEDLRINAEIRKQFEQSLETEYKSFDGFNVTFKDETAGIEIPISYVPTEEEKVSLKNELSDFDHTEYFGNRWFSADGKPQVKNMMADKYFLENKEKIMQKVANEAAQQMRLKMIAMQSNINLKGNSNQQVFTPNSTEQDEAFARTMFGA